MQCNRRDGRGAFIALSRLKKAYRFYRCYNCGRVRTINQLQTSKRCCIGRVIPTQLKLWEEIWFIIPILLGKVKADWSDE